MERWKINRAGVINFWYYDHEEFQFEDGRLLLRGSNGSGKSVTMQSLVPLLFDGNKSPERLDPFGSRARKMENYLLSDGLNLDERTGYLFLEFKKPSMDRYKTIGMGMRARKNMPLQTWYFIINDNRRIGVQHQLSLYKDVGSELPLSHKELENKIGSGGHVYSRQRDYKEAVNNALFGYSDISDFEELIELLIQIRSPKLSKEFKPTTMYEIMQNSLFTLTEDDIRPMSEAIESMDEVKEKIDLLSRVKKSMDKIGNIYDRYNQYVLTYKANKYMELDKEKRSIHKKNKNLNSQLEDLNIEKSENAASLESLKEEERLLRDKENQLKEHDLTKVAEEKIELEQNIQVVTTSLEKKKQSLARIVTEKLDLDQKKKNVDHGLYKHRKTSKEIMENLQLYATQPKYDECSFMLDDYEKDFGQLNFEHYKKHLNDYIFKIKEGLEGIRTYNKTANHYDQLKEKQDLDLGEIEAQGRKVQDYEKQLNQIREEYAEKLTAWASENKTFTINRDIINKTIERVFQYGDIYSSNEVMDLVNNSYGDFKNHFNKNISALEGKKQNLTEEITLNQHILKEIIEKKEPTPERSFGVLENREKLQELGIVFVPLYQVLDFNKDIDQKVKNNLEEALVELGLLDALIIDPKHKDTVLQLPEGTSDKYIFANPNMFSHNLSTYLRVDQGTVVDKALVEDIIQSILLDVGGDTYISEEGHYGHGLIVGKISGSYESKFISYQSRKRYKEEQIQGQNLIINNLCRRIEQLDKEIQGLKESLLAGRGEYDLFPNREDLMLAFDELKSNRLELATKKKAYDQFLLVVEEVYEAVRIAKKTLHEKTTDIYLKTNELNFEEALKDLDLYKDSLYEFINVSTEIAHTLNLLENLDERYDICLMTMDEVSYDIEIAEVLLRKNAAKLDVIKGQLATSDYTEFAKQLSLVKQRISEMPLAIQLCFKIESGLETRMNALNQNIEEIIEKLATIDIRLATYEWAFLSELKLGFVEIFQVDEPDDEGDKSLDLIAIGKRIMTAYGNVLEASKTVVELRDELNRRFHEEQGILTEYNMKMTSLFREIPFQVDENDMIHIERIDITCRAQGKNVKFGVLQNLISAQIESNRHVLGEQDRMLFEEILIKSISRKISSKIYHSEKWVKEIDSLMSNMNTSSGLKFNLRWKPKNATIEDQMGTGELVSILKSDQSILTTEQRERLIKHFRSKIEESRERLGEDGDHRNFLTVIKEVLDYRKWFEFQLYFTKTGDKKKELTNNAFFTFSGGEKAMAMYVPLFSAVYAKYQSGGPECPKVVSLDEAFAGVDEKNIKDMFKLLVELDLSFVANSQVLFGDYDTVPALGIYELIRPENVTYVTLIRYLWNGKVRKMVTDDA